MDNSMNAIISIIMIGIGFVNGFGWSKVLRLQEIVKLQEELYAEKCLNNDYLDTIERLEKQNERLKENILDSEEKFEAIKHLILIPTCLPPPNSPLSRSEPLLRSSTSTSLSSTD